MGSAHLVDAHVQFGDRQNEVGNEFRYSGTFPLTGLLQFEKTSSQQGWYKEHSYVLT